MLPAVTNIINKTIDFFYPPFARIIPQQTFRYLACGGSNTVLSLFIYSFAFNIVLHRATTHIAAGLDITAPVGAQILSLCVTFPIGFFLSRYIVFPESNLRGRKQLFRYALTTATFILLTYVLIKTFALLLPAVRADISFVFICIIITVLSYLSQRFFTFKSTVEDELTEEDL